MLARAEAADSWARELLVGGRHNGSRTALHHSIGAGRHDAVCESVRLQELNIQKHVVPIWPKSRCGDRSPPLYEARRANSTPMVEESVRCHLCMILDQFHT